MKPYTVRAVRCDYRASDEEVYQKLCQATAPLARSWEKIEKARQVVIKLNMSRPPEMVTRFEGRRRELVDESVLLAVVRLLREHTSARLVFTDTGFQSWFQGKPTGDINYLGILNELGVDYVDSSSAPLATFDVPGGGLMFSRYLLNACFAEADAVISVAKLKNHLFQGVTLSLKNLFGLMPLPPLGRGRWYFHHIIRLSRILPDLGLITQPCLNLVDGLVGQAGREWDGQGRIANLLLAGDHTIATDVCGAWLMGHDPAADWPQQPFLRERSALLVAAENGFGTVNLEEIDFQSELDRPVAQFATDRTDTPETVVSWRRTTCEQALLYRDRRQEYVDRYAGEYIMLQDGQVIWHGQDPTGLGSRRVIAGEKKDSAIWLKLVDPEEKEGEHFEVYEQELPRIREVEAQLKGE